MFAGCGLALVGLTLTIGGLLVENFTIVMVGFIITVIMMVATLCCTLLAVLRIDGRLTPGGDIILQPGFSSVTADEVIDLVQRSDDEFMADLIKNIPRFQYVRNPVD